MGETGSNEFDEHSSKDQDLAASQDRLVVEAPKDNFVESEISVCVDNNRNGQMAEQSMASLLDQLGTKNSADDSWISDAPADNNEASEYKMNKNEEQQKSLFGAYNIMKAHVSIDKGHRRSSDKNVRPRSSNKLLPAPLT